MDDFRPVVSATGVVLPAQYATLSMSGAGILEEVLVSEGEAVEAGQLLARLEYPDNREALEAGVAGAELERLAAEQALADLFEAHDLQVAQAQLALANARDQLHDAEYRWSNQQPGQRASGATLQAAEANLILAENEVERAEKEYNRVSGRREDDPLRALALSNLAAARQQRDAVLRQLNWYQGQPTDIDQSMLDAEVAFAQAQLGDAEREWQTLQGGPEAEALALAEARLRSAQAQLAAAQAALDDLDEQIPELISPISGVVVRQALKQGENAVPGQVAIVVADLGRWKVETDDLTEIEVVSVSVGQQVTIVPDSLPDVELTGLVDSISQLFEEKRGDVTYTARVLLDEIDPRLRWGMTVVVTFPES